MLYFTPIKQERAEDNQKTEIKTLKQAINERLLNTAVKKQDSKSQFNSNKTVHKRFDHLTNQSKRLQGSSAEQLRLIKQMAKYQSKENHGYFQFQNWKGFNSAIFPHVSQDIVRQFWKILRIINYGEVLIPTGLIYEISHWLLIGSKYLENSKKEDIKKKNKNSLSSLKIVLDDFLNLNQVIDSVATFRQLSNYMPLQKIENLYIVSSVANQNQKIKSLKRQFYRSNSQKIHVFQRCFKDAKLRQQSLLKRKHASIVEQTTECKHIPTISKYSLTSKDNLKAKCQRVCHKKHQYESDYLENIDFLMNCEPLFKAKEIDEKIYAKVLEEIPGVNEHLNRNKYSQAEKQRLQRFMIKPQVRKEN